MMSRIKSMCSEWIDVSRMNTATHTQWVHTWRGTINCMMYLLINCFPMHRTYADMAGPEIAAKYQTLIFLAGSASAEFFADIALCPFEAVKVRNQDCTPSQPYDANIGLLSNMCATGFDLSDNKAWATAQGLDTQGSASSPYSQIHMTCELCCCFNILQLAIQTAWVSVNSGYVELPLQPCHFLSFALQMMLC